MAKRKAKRISKPQPEQNTMYFITENATQFLDCAAALTAINRKQYHQTRNFKPLAYHVRAQCITTGSDSTPILFGTAPNTWTTRNAVTKLGIMYKKQLRDNSLKVSQLPTYARELRLSLKTGEGYTQGTANDGLQDATLDNSGAGKAFIPEDIDGGACFTSYTNTDGVDVTYFSSNDLTVLSIPEATASGEPETVVPALIGTSDHGANDLAVIPEFLSSRRNAHDHTELNHDLPEDTNLLHRLGAAANEHFDDIVGAIEQTGTERPYDEAGANRVYLQGALMAAGDYTSFVAPLGLIEINGNADSKFLLTVTAITEM